MITEYNTIQYNTITIKVDDKMNVDDIKSDMCRNQTRFFN